MMADYGWDIHLENEKQVLRALRKGKGLIRTAIKDGMMAGGRVMNRKIRDNAPEDTGLLKACVGEFDDSEFKGPNPNRAPRTGIKSGSGFISTKKPRKSWAVFKYDPKKFSLTIGTKVPYADWVERGVNVPGPIRATNKNYMRYMINGKIFYRKEVKGHTIAPTFFFQRGVNDSKADFAKEMNKTVASALRRIGR